MATHALTQLAVFMQEGKDGIEWNRDPGERAAQSWTTGTPLIEHGDDKNVLIAASDTEVAILGFAAGPSTGTTGAAVPYYEANEDLLIVASLYDDDAAGVLAAGDINTAYGLAVDATGNTYVDKNNTTAGQKKVIILAPAPGSAIGDTGARVICRVCSDMQAKTAVA